LKTIRAIALLVAFALSFALHAPAAAADEDYGGADAGILIYSAGSIAMPLAFEFRYRRIGLPAGAAASDWSGRIESRTGGFSRAHVSGAEYSGRETGRVFVRRLPPGNYEVHGFRFAGTRQFRSRRPFSIPFTIRPGQATYIGNFARAPSLGTPLQRTLGAVGFFVISDRSERDVALARGRFPELPPVTVEVTDVTAFGHTMLLAREPQ
jgi:hypothetical protein